MPEPSEAQNQLDNAASALNQAADKLPTAGPIAQPDERNRSMRDAVFHLGRAINHTLAAVQLLVREHDRDKE